MRDAKHSRPAGDRTAAGFLKQESGSVTIFALAGFAMCLVVTGLAFDVGRVMSIHTQASSYADQAALAASSELDNRFANGGDNALMNARNAALGLGVGQRMTLGGDSSLRIKSLRFYSDIGAPPGGDVTARSPWPGDERTATWTAEGNSWSFASGFNFTTASLQSRYVLVDIVTIREEFTLLPLVSIFGGSSESGANMAPQAMAGFERRMCNIAPIMVCNPRDTTTAPGPAFDPTEEIPYTFTLQGARRNGDRNDRWGPGFYSLLETANTNARALRDYIADVDPGTACYGDTSRVLRSPNAGDGAGNNNTRHQIGVGWNNRYSQPSRRRFPVAVVNCLDNLQALQRGRAVPVAGYAQAELVPVPGSNPPAAVDLSSGDGDEITLISRGIVSSTVPVANRREFSVLVR